MNENMAADHSGSADMTLSPEERASLQERYRNALAEVERLSHADDRASGSADRTAREAGRAMWLAETERLRALLGEPMADAIRESLEGRIVDGA